MVSIFSRAIARLAKRRPLNALNHSPFNHHGRKGLLWTFLPMLLCIPLIAQEVKESAPKPAETPIKYSGIRYQSGNRRDPFLNPLFLKKKVTQQEDEEVTRGLPPPGIAGTYIAQATLQGVTVRETANVAVVRGADSRAYFIRVGDRLFDGYVRTIQNDSITFVRETKLKSGKTLTQDVTKRLRTQ
jgi:Tfp pilus assembly protein PilP